MVKIDDPLNAKLKSDITYHLLNFVTIWPDAFLIIVLMRFDYLSFV